MLVNEAYVIVGDLGFETAGPVTRVTEVLGSDRLRVGGEHGMQSTILLRSAELAKSALKSGDEVRVDPSYRMALEALPHPESREHYLDVVPELPWEKVGGQEEALRAIRDAIELPLIHGELFAKFQHATPKGFLLYGPPGCGKTLIGKATAYNLTRQLREKTGNEMKEYFMHVKGPEILNMWVGESERMVREIFATAREKRREGFLPFLFIDEAESILGTRRASRHANILSTLVPMFCSEMDGIDSLGEVVIILASNRADLIDPAILRPGRIDRKIKVQRPNRAGARDIYRIYLTDDLPYDGALPKEAGGIGAAIDQLIERLAGKTVRAPRGKQIPRDHPAERPQGNALPQRPAFRRDHCLNRRARQGHRHQTRHRRRRRRRAMSAGERRHQRKRSSVRLPGGVLRERYFSADRYDGGLVQADRFRSGKRRQDRAGEAGRERRAEHALGRDLRPRSGHGFFFFDFASAGVGEGVGCTDGAGVPALELALAWESRSS